MKMINIGGSSGIGYATSKLLVAKGATVHNVDVKRPGPEHDDDEWGGWANYHVHLADVTEWAQLRAAFDAAGVPDFVFANAGGPVGAEDETFFDDHLDDQGRLAEPQYDNMAVNTRGTVATVKLAWSSMRKAKKEGSIVITGASLGYFPEQGLPIWSSAQSFVSPKTRALGGTLELQCLLTHKQTAPRSRTRPPKQREARQNHHQRRRARRGHHGHAPLGLRRPLAQGRDQCLHR